MKKADNLVQEIKTQYNNLILTDYGFFDSFHDTLSYQVSGAEEEADEIDFYFRNKDTESVNNGIARLERTLEFCKEVLKIQKLIKNLPDTIYG